MNAPPAENITYDKKAIAVSGIGVVVAIVVGVSALVLCIGCLIYAYYEYKRAKNLEKFIDS
jgi:hypothetical protein